MNFQSVNNLPSIRWKRCLKCKFQAFGDLKNKNLFTFQFHIWNDQHYSQDINYLIFNTNFCPESVFRGPLLREHQPIFSPFVLGFKGSSDLAGIDIGWAWCFKFLKQIN